MGTTTPRTWKGEPVLTTEKLDVIREWYVSNLADEDKAGNDTHDWYWGYRTACEDILGLLHDEPDNEGGQVVVTTLVAFVTTAENEQEAQKKVMSLLPREDINTAAWEGAGLDCWWIAEDDRVDGSDCDSAVFIPEWYGKRHSQTEVHALLRYMSSRQHAPADVIQILIDRDEMYRDADREGRHTCDWTVAGSTHHCRRCLIEQGMI